LESVNNGGMSVRFLSKVWSDKTITSHGELLVMLALADFSDDSGISWPSIETLAAKSRYSIRGVQGVISKLMADGKIGVQQGGGSPGSTNQYRILSSPELPPQIDATTPAEFAPLPPQTTADTPANRRIDPRKSPHRPPQIADGGLRGIRQDPSEGIRQKGSVKEPSGDGAAVREFPTTIDDAIEQCGMVAIPKEFVMHCFDKGFSRGGLDSRQIPIVNFPAHVRTEWKYEQERKYKNKLLSKNGMPSPGSGNF